MCMWYVTNPWQLRSFRSVKFQIPSDKSAHEDEYYRLPNYEDTARKTRPEAHGKVARSLSTGNSTLAFGRANMIPQDIRHPCTSIDSSDKGKKPIRRFRLWRRLDSGVGCTPKVDCTLCFDTYRPLSALLPRMTHIRVHCDIDTLTLRTKRGSRTASRL